MKKNLTCSKGRMYKDTSRPERDLIF